MIRTRRLAFVLFVIALTTAFLAHITPAQAQTSFQATLLGASLLRDADFPGNRDQINVFGLATAPKGGRLLVVFRNTSTVSARLNDILIGGKPFAQLSSDPQYAPRVPDLKWWRVWPDPVPPGQVAALTVRLVDLAVDLPAGAGLELRTDRGNQSFSAPAFNPQSSSLRIVALNITPDLDTVTLFVANSGTGTINLKSNGGFSINGGPEYTTSTLIGQTSLAPGDVVPIIVRGTSRDLIAGAQTFSRVNADSGVSAIASLRALPYRFAIHSQMQGTGFDRLDRARHFVGDWMPAARSLLDEPLASGRSPGDVVATVNAWLRAEDRSPDQRASEAQIRAQQQTEIHNTSYVEGLVYDDIADIASTHWGNPRQDLSTYLTAPKPNWYMPQNSWGQNEGLYIRERWYPLEDLWLQAYQAVGRGAKGIQWFLYQSHWEQGWGRKAGTDFARLYQDRLRSGHVANPLVWNTVGRVSGSLSVLEPYLTNSAFYASSRSAGFSIDTVASVNEGVDGIYKAVVTIVDERTPRSLHAGYLFSYRSTGFSHQARYNQSIRVRLPAYLANAVTTAYSIDPWLGVLALPVSRSDANEVMFEVPAVRTAALVLLGNAADAAPLQSAWQRVATGMTSYGDTMASLSSQGRPVPNSPWHDRELTYRQRISVTNSGSTPAEVLEAPLRLPIERAINYESIRVLEVSGQDASLVPSFVQGEQRYESFGPDAATRLTGSCIGSASPAGCPFRLESVDGGLRVHNDARQEGYAWFLNFSTPQPWGATTPDGSIPARFSTLSVELQLGDLPFWQRSALFVSFDLDGDGRPEKGKPIFLRSEAHVIEDLDDGWSRYTIDIRALFNDPTLFPDQPFRGSYRVQLQTHVLPGSSRTGSYPFLIRNLSVRGGDRVWLVPTTSLRPGETRTYEVYYDVRENDRGLTNPQIRPSLVGATAALSTLASVTAPESAGVHIQVNSATLIVRPQADVSALLVRHVAASGAMLSAQRVMTSAGQAVVHLTRAPQAGDLLVVIPLQPGGEGHTFVFNEHGRDIVGRVPSALVRPAASIMRLSDLASPGERIAPFSLDLSPDGRHLAVGLARVKDDRSDTTGVVLVFDQTGRIIWERSFEGRVFYVRFAPDSSGLFVAANLGPDGTNELYRDAHILKFSLDGSERWRHKVGSGTGMPVEREGRTVFDLEVYPNGDVLYAEWNTYGVKLDGGNGTVRWTVDTAYNSTTYTSQVVALRNGGAVLLGNWSKCVDPNGTVIATVFLGGETPIAAAAIESCQRWAIAGSSVRIITQPGLQRTDRFGEPGYLGPGTYVGRYPRALAFSPDGAYVAAGTSDGTFTLMDSDGKVLWQKADGASYVTHVQFLPDGKGIAFAREVFSYHSELALVGNNSGWRFRDTVEAYDLQGRPLWRHEGRWRETEPFMTQFALSASGKILTVMSGEELRVVDLTRPAIPNFYLYTDGTGEFTTLYLPLMATVRNS